MEQQLWINLVNKSFLAKLANPYNLKTKCIQNISIYEFTMFMTI